jgi:hypothetical protein
MIIPGGENIEEKKTNWPAGSVCEMVGLAKKIQQLDFGRRSCRYICEHFNKYIILILAADRKGWTQFWFVKCTLNRIIFIVNNFIYRDSLSQLTTLHLENVFRPFLLIIPIKYFLTHNQTYKDEDKLQDFVHDYNNRSHRSLSEETPVEITPRNEDIPWKHLCIDTIRLLFLNIFSTRNNLLTSFLTLCSSGS